MDCFTYPGTGRVHQSYLSPVRAGTASGAQYSVLTSAKPSVPINTCEHLKQRAGP